MIEEQILQMIADHVKDDRLHFQVIIQEQTLHVYINRDTKEYLDYSQITSSIHEAIAELEELDLLAMELYSRVLGEIEPDWHKYVELTAENSTEESLDLIVNELDNTFTNTKSLSTQVEQEIHITSKNQSDSDIELIANSEDSNQQDISQDISRDLKSIDLDKPESTPAEDLESVAAESADFSQYCFIRNQRLLNAELVAPQGSIAQIVDTFDKFEESVKRSQLPLLESYFKKSQEPELSSFEPEIQSWWADILAINMDHKRKLAIWLSRYCYDPESTIVTIEKVVITQTEAKKFTEEQSRKKAKEAREARNHAYIESLNSANIRESEPKKSQYNLSFWITSITSTLFVIAIRPVVKPFISNISDSNHSNSQQEIVISDSQVATQPSQSPSSQGKQLIDLGLKKYHQQDFNGALENLTEAIELYLANSDGIVPDSGLERAYNLRGLVLQQLNDYHPAINDANQAIELSPHNSEYYANRGKAYLGLRDYNSAIADQTHAIKLKPKNSHWYVNRGKAYYEGGDYDQALADLDLAIALNYFAIEAYEQRYYTHRALGNLEEAEADYQQAKYFGVEPQK